MNEGKFLNPFAQGEAGQSLESEKKPEQEVVAEKILDLLLDNKNDEAFELKERFRISDKVMQDISINLALARLARGSYIPNKLLGRLAVPDDFFETEEARQAAKKAVLITLSDGRRGSCRIMARDFHLAEWLATSPEVMDAIDKGMWKIMAEKGSEQGVKFKAEMIDHFNRTYKAAKKESLK